MVINMKPWTLASATRTLMTSDFTPLIIYPLRLGAAEMAEIILEPGEVFEHYHANPSTTYLIEGRVRLSFDGREFNLKPGQVIVIPPSVPHVIENLGSNSARVGCGHGPDAPVTT
jgi:quercetin dioxygenase-like cupin family protein